MPSRCPIAPHGRRNVPGADSSADWDLQDHPVQLSEARRTSPEKLPCFNGVIPVVEIEFLGGSRRRPKVQVHRRDADATGLEEATLFIA